MIEKRFTTVELPNPNKWGIWYDGAYLSTYQVCTLLNEYVDIKKENEQLKKDKEKLFDYFAKWFEEERGTYIEDFIELWKNIQNGELE